MNYRYICAYVHTCDIVSMKVYVHMFVVIAYMCIMDWIHVYACVYLYISMYMCIHCVYVYMFVHAWVYSCT